MACLHGLESADLLIHVIGPEPNQSRYQSAVCGLSKHINRFRFLLSRWSPQSKGQQSTLRRL